MAAANNKKKGKGKVTPSLSNTKRDKFSKKEKPIPKRTKLSKRKKTASIAKKRNNARKQLFKSR